MWQSFSAKMDRFEKDLFVFLLPTAEGTAEGLMPKYIKCVNVNDVMWLLKIGRYENDLYVITLYGNIICYQVTNVMG